MNYLTPHQSNALNIEKSISLTANAGSGKTFVLAQRFLQIILTTNTPLNKIAAITFTEKAASELYKRISIELDKQAAICDDAELKRKIEKIRKQLVSANISTIHSFCIDLLKEFPVEASLDANFLTINEQKSSELIDLSLENTIRDLLRDTNMHSDVKILIRLLGSTTRLFSELSSIIKKRHTVLKLIDEYYSNPEEVIADSIYKLFEKNIKILFDEELDKILTHLKKINSAVLKINPDNELAIEINSIAKKFKPEQSSILNLEYLNRISSIILTGTSQVRKQKYLASEYREEQQDSIKTVEEFFSQLKEIEFTSEHKNIESALARHITSFINVFEKVLQTYENKKNELGVLDFEDILIYAKNLLTEDSVRTALSGKFNYLLVDEYQDTNEIQYEIFLPLLDNLKKGNLFVVGDEKQSIYRFRDADLQVFSKTKYDIMQVDGKDSLLTLPDSFRMASSICLFVNTLFQNLFKNPRLFFNEVASTDLVCARTDSFFGKIEILVADENEEEAELIAKKIILLKNDFSEQLKEWNDFAVLVRKRASFTELQKAFIKHNIPFNLVGGTGFYQKQSISDIYNYFAFMLNEKDDASLIGVLRSSFFLVSDVEILELSEFDGESYWKKNENAANDGNEFWKKIYDSISQNKSLSSRISIPHLLRKILSESTFISVISSRNDREQEISNLNKLISITNDFFTEEFRTLYDYVKFLKDSIEGTEDEAQGRIDPGSIGVNIMTIHQAKGLEYPAVFLYKCNETGQQNKVKAKSFIVDKDFGILTKVPLNENYFGNYHSAPAVGLFNVFEEKKQFAELKRLLYVGLTRARDFLFISYSENNKSPKRNSFMDLIGEGLQSDFSNSKIKISGDLTFLQSENDEYVNFIKHIDIEIPLIRKIEVSGEVIDKDSADPSLFKFYLSEIADQSKGEVISATRYSTFSSCPMKYNLIYNYKISDLLQKAKRYFIKIKRGFSEEYNRSELESHLLDDQVGAAEFSKIKGQLIHDTLRKNISKDNLGQFVSDRLKKYNSNEHLKDLETEIISDLLNYYNSEVYQWVNSFSEYYNEYESYLAEKNYYLFGILDKLIIETDRLIIIDYKTDNLEKKEIANRATRYLPQLKFYAYIVSRLFPKIPIIEGRVIFIKHPDESYRFEYNKDDDMNIKSEIERMILSIRNNSYAYNSEQCSDCILASGSKSCMNFISKLN